MCFRVNIDQGNLDLCDMQEYSIFTWEQIVANHVFYIYYFTNFTTLLLLMLSWPSWVSSHFVNCFTGNIPICVTMYPRRATLLTILSVSYSVNSRSLKPIFH